MDDHQNMRHDKQRSPETNVEWARATQWISRTLAVVIVMVTPGVLGAMLDHRFETSFLALLGFALGLVLGTAGLLALAKRFTPPAGGKSLPWGGDTPSESDADESSHSEIHR